MSTPSSMHMRRNAAYRHLGWILPILLAVHAQAQGELEGVAVEVYYISDANDATDTLGGGIAEGSRTYRVFVDLCDSCSLRGLYGSVDHPLRIASTLPFFNNLDRGRTYGHEINNGALDENTVALDSWFALGAASSQKYGIPKTDDPDGSILGGNDGGSAQVPGGLLQNTDPLAGVPLDSLDGLVSLNGGAALPPGFTVTGTPADGVFRDSTVASLFETIDTRISCTTPGVQGPTPQNRILVAQLTTAGELTFLLNIEVQRPDGSVIRFVAQDTLLQPDEVANGALAYPPLCGCTDPQFLEYDPSAGCDDGSCQTAIVFGCTDTLACNFDPDANFNIPLLCCYGPGDCNGLDIAIVCPDVSVLEAGPQAQRPTIHPNPVDDEGLTVTWHGRGTTRLQLMDAAGRSVLEHSWDDNQRTVDVSALPPGAYIALLERSGERHTRMILRR